MFEPGVVQFRRRQPEYFQYVRYHKVVFLRPQETEFPEPIFYLYVRSHDPGTTGVHDVLQHAYPRLRLYPPPRAPA